MSLNSRRISLKIPLLFLALTILVVACKKEEKPPELGVYATPDAAAQALDTAVKAGDINALVGIFGPDSKQLILSGDDVQERTPPLNSPRATTSCTAGARCPTTPRCSSSEPTTFPSPSR